MKKIYDNLLFTRMSIRYVSSTQINKYVNNYSWQFVEVLSINQWRQNHLLYATHLTPINFLNDYKEVINKNKKVILFGDWRRNVCYYRILKHHGYKSYLVKQKGKKLWKEKTI